MAAKERLDVLLVEKGLCESREKAKKMIMAGLVFVDHQKEDKAGTKIKKDAEIYIKEDPNPYVSRGGLKLAKALKTYNFDLTDTVCMDIGASTGGFTDCMLQNGAKKVYAIDVGYGQLAWKLRQDERVVNFEKTNAKYLDETMITDPINFFSVDVSFISLKKVLPSAFPFLVENGEFVALIKPQFEAGREKVGKKGVVREPKTHREVIVTIVNFLKIHDIKIVGLQYSPITGPEGNIEYLVYGSKDKEKEDYAENLEDEIKSIVDTAHKDLYGK